MALLTIVGSIYLLSPWSGVGSPIAVTSVPSLKFPRATMKVPKQRTLSAFA